MSVLSSFEGTDGKGRRGSRKKEESKVHRDAVREERKDEERQGEKREKGFDKKEGSEQTRVDKGRGAAG